jgi:tetratricopeptide (TPR) repeat protein
MVLGGAFAAYYKYVVNAGTVAGSEVPILGLDDAVRPEPGAKPLRIVREDAQGIWAEDALGQPVLVPAADLESGKARRITGLRKAVDVKFFEKKNAPPGHPALFTIEEPNAVVAKQCEKQALELYRARYLPGKEAALYGAVRLFQKSLAYNGGRGYFDDPSVDKIYRDAVRELIEALDRHYRNAVILEESDTYKQALETYKHILNIFPERENPVFENVARRMTQLRRRHPDLL